jgi:L-alanine-DL-glutamate epimerase and related enzymes of enolase superfamily
LGCADAPHLTLLTGEKLELVRGFRPFLDNQVVDIIHPDLAFAGGITGTKKIADFAALSRTPVALHNVGSLILTYANAHFAASIQNFYQSESALGREGHRLEGMAATNPPVVRGGMLKVPGGPGLGVVGRLPTEEHDAWRNVLGLVCSPRLSTQNYRPCGQ